MFVLFVSCLAGTPAASAASAPEEEPPRIEAVLNSAPPLPAEGASEAMAEVQSAAKQVRMIQYLVLWSMRFI